MKASKILILAAAALMTGMSLQGCKKQPFQVLAENVDKVNAAIADGKMADVDKIITFDKVDYDEVTNTVKINVKSTATTDVSDMALYLVDTLCPELDAAIKEADANVMVVNVTPDGDTQETLYENQEPVPVE